MVEELLIKTDGADHDDLHPSYSSVTPVKILYHRSMAPKAKAIVGTVSQLAEMRRSIIE